MEHADNSPARTLTRLMADRRKELGKMRVAGRLMLGALRRAASGLIAASPRPK